jgi:hypothetical protein
VFAYTYFTFPPKLSNNETVDPSKIPGYTPTKIFDPSIIPQLPNIVSWTCNTNGQTNGCFPQVYGPGMTKGFNGGGFGGKVKYV